MAILKLSDMKCELRFLSLQILGVKWDLETFKYECKLLF